KSHIDGTVNIRSSGVRRPCRRFCFNLTERWHGHRTPDYSSSLWRFPLEARRAARSDMLSRICYRRIRHLGAIWPQSRQLVALGRLAENTQPAPRTEQPQRVRDSAEGDG